MNISRNITQIMGLVLLLLMIFPSSSEAQVPARFYWKSLIGGNALPLINMDMSGNANPLDPALQVEADAGFDANIALAGYGTTFTLFGKSAMAAALLPVGRVSAQGTLAGRSTGLSTNGFGDPTLELVVNLIGPPPIKNIPDAIRYEPGFSMDVLVDVIVPIGEYDNDSPLNIGQNRWYGRVGAPIVWQLGDWVPGRKTTLEFLPSVWLFGDNDDFAGRNLSTDPKFQLEAHLTRDFHQNLWGSFDTNWVSGGKSTVNGVTGEDLDMLGVGFTLGYHFNDNIQLTAGYLASVNDTAPTDLRMDIFKLSLVFGWHPLVEGMKRLGKE
jgi:hypothetical protein